MLSELISGIILQNQMAFIKQICILWHSKYWTEKKMLNTDAMSVSAKINLPCLAFPSGDCDPCLPSQNPFLQGCLTLKFSTTQRTPRGLLSLIWPLIPSSLALGSVWFLPLLRKVKQVWRSCLQWLCCRYTDNLDIQLPSLQVVDPKDSSQAGNNALAMFFTNRDIQET